MRRGGEERRERRGEERRGEKMRGEEREKSSPEASGGNLLINLIRLELELQRVVLRRPLLLPSRYD